MKKITEWNLTLSIIILLLIIFFPKGIFATPYKPAWAPQEGENLDGTRYQYIEWNPSWSLFESPQWYMDEKWERDESQEIDDPSLSHHDWQFVNDSKADTAIQAEEEKEASLGMTIFNYPFDPDRIKKIRVFVTYVDYISGIDGKDRWSTSINFNPGGGGVPEGQTFTTKSELVKKNSFLNEDIYNEWGCVTDIWDLSIFPNPAYEDITLFFNRSDEEGFYQKAVVSKIGVYTICTPVPEPSTCLLFLFGMLGTICIKKKFS